MAKDGRAYLGSLKDNRTIYIDGRRVADVTTDPAFANAVASAARLYDFQADPANLEAMTFCSPTSRERVNRAWQLPRRRKPAAWSAARPITSPRHSPHGPVCVPRAPGLSALKTSSG
jgi:aromatic ring hydroxylase